jgi:serine/threonine protein kinase
MLRPDGYVKVLDFGLAQVADHRAPARDARIADRLEASSGLVMGTVKYMSPEQARGLPVDQRSDIFSLGVVLYEMIAGRAPFAGENANELINAILKKEPAPLSDVPEEITQLVRRALGKKKAERYQSIQDFLADLKALKDDKSIQAIGRIGSQHAGESAPLSGASGAISTASTFEYAASGIRRYKTAALILAGVVVLSLGVTFGLNRYLRALRAPSRNIKITRVPNTGKSFAAAISPDGKSLAHAMTSAGKQSLWLIDLGTNATVELIPAANVEYSGLTFSKDGNNIFYASYGTLYQVPVHGG